mmetsp:Transcript_16660/g.38104  ORF Transcript_16660/g.38104 Transcript_16660/m.38104 type:complete len:311 (-) Transcript_16660:18-950(-)
MVFRSFQNYFKPHPSRSVMAPPSKSLFLTSLRRDKKVSYPSMVLSCVVVMGFPWRFRSISNVLVQSSFGSGCGSFGDSLFLRSERTFSFASFPMAGGRSERPLSSRFSSLRALAFAMLSGTEDKLFDERSSFSNIFNGLLPLKMLRGIAESELFERSIVLRPFGSFIGSASAVAGAAAAEPFLLLLATAGRQPSRLLLAESVFSLGSVDIASMLPGASLLLSTFNDLSTFSWESFGLSLTSLFFDKSSVVSLTISKTWFGHASNLCSLSDNTPVFPALISFCSTTFRPVLLCGWVFPMVTFCSGLVLASW